LWIFSIFYSKLLHLYFLYSIYSIAVKPKFCEIVNNPVWNLKCHGSENGQIYLKKSKQHKILKFLYIFAHLNVNDQQIILFFFEGF